MNGSTGRAGAMLLGWSELARSDRAEFVEFHDREHMAERYAVPGFLRAARYVAGDNDTTFLTIYDIDKIATLISDPYLERLNNPTRWTLETLPKIRGGRRVTVKIDYCEGTARGGHILCTEWTGLTDQAQQAVLRAAIAPLIARSGIVSVKAGPVDLQSSRVETAESLASQRVTPTQGCLAVIEGVSADALREVRAILLDAVMPVAISRAGIYRLEASLG